MLTLTQADLLHAAILANFLYGALLIATAPSRIALDSGSALLVAVTGAAGHLFHASIQPAAEAPNGAPPLLLMFDIVLVFVSLIVFLLTFPRLAHLVVDTAGGFLGY